MLAVCIVVSVLAQPAPTANVTTANEETIVVFDTGPSYCPYPSIMGTHNGTITPYVTIYNVSKLYTYPCEGTGGHTESVVFYYPNGTKITEGHWVGYSGDGHNITFPAFSMIANHTYYYSIRTGSYPQIHHANEWEAKEGMGIINCTSFVDANGRSYDNWIPAIRLVGCTSDSNVTLIGDIKANPEAYEGKIVTIVGECLEYCRWECGPGPPVTRSDWCIEDGTGCIYVARGRPFGELLKIEGMVKLYTKLNITCPYTDPVWTLDGVELSCHDIGKIVKVNETATYTIIVTNTESVRDTFNLRITNVDNASVAKLSTYSITIDARANGYVTLEVADESTERYKVYKVAVTATPQRNRNNTDTIGTYTTVIMEV
jgi:hypothetical protein